MARYIEVKILTGTTQEKQELINFIEKKKFYPVEPLGDYPEINEDPDLGYYQVAEDADMRLFYQPIAKGTDSILLYWRKDIITEDGDGEIDLPGTDLSEFIAWCDKVIGNSNNYDLEIIDDIDEINPWYNVQRRKTSTLRFPNWWPAYYTIRYGDYPEPEPES